jgi:hypothetical protein
VGRSESGKTGTAFIVLIGVSISRLLNDGIQSLLPAIYPGLKSAFGLDFGQVGSPAAARTIAVQPRVLFLDEPLSNLDAKLRAPERFALKALRGDFGPLGPGHLPRLARRGRY